MDDELHGKASLYHNTHLLFTASYLYGVMYFKRQQCDGIIISPSGCKPIRAPQPPKTRSMKYIESVNSETSALVADPVAPTASEEVKERRDEEELSDDCEIYTDDVVFYQKGENAQKQVKEKYLLIVGNMILNDISTKYCYYERPNRSPILYLLSDYKTENYLLETQIQNGVPNGFGLLYSTRTLEVLCRIQFQLGVPMQCFLMKMDKKESDYVVETLDMNDEGERWEGEVRNLLPNGQGQFFNTDNVCIYEGAMVNGKANGIGTGFYPDLETKAYYGKWKNNRRHGLGREFNRKGEFMRSGLWLDGSFAEMETLPNDVNTPLLQPSSYCKLVRVMYLNDSALHGRKVNTVENFPLLKALFLDSQCVGASEWIVKDMPMLEKIVAGIRHDGCWCNHYIRFMNCPRLCEMWTIVDFAHGTVFVQREDSNVGRYDPKRLEEHFEPRFVLGELAKQMKWKQQREAKEEEELRYYLLEKARYDYVLTDPKSGVCVDDFNGLYASGKESCYCSQLSAIIYPKCNMCIDKSIISEDQDGYCYEGCLRRKEYSVCWNNERKNVQSLLLFLSVSASAQTVAVYPQSTSFSQGDLHLQRKRRGKSHLFSSFVSLVPCMLYPPFLAAYATQ